MKANNIWSWKRCESHYRNRATSKEANVVIMYVIFDAMTSVSVNCVMVVNSF